MNLKRFAVGISCLLSATAWLAAPSDAAACGGLFCSRTPVDQTAEHIIFTINGDHTVTAYVQISYSGDPDDFAWIVPAPSAPKLSANFPNAAMLALDSATQPRYFRNNCYFAGGPVAAGNGTGGSGGTGGGGGVTIIDRQNVGPYDTVTLEGTSAALIVDWLQKNGYRITDKMIPFIQPYVEAGMKFVAMRLQQGSATSDITPIAMTYDSDKPAIPIRLTTVAAQPEMGIVAFVLADKRWAPDSYVDLTIPDSLIQFDQYGSQSNYLTVVSREVDKVGGQAFVTEYAQSTADLAQQLQSQFVPQATKDALLNLLTRFPYMTRMYTRMSAEEMTDDPTFKVASTQTDVSNIHNLADPTASCSFPPPPDPCRFTYCGREGVCTPASVIPVGSTTPTSVAACVCATTAVARATTTGGASSGQPYCEPQRMNLDSAPAGADAGTALVTSTACDGYSCGAHGHCVSMNGNPTCKCDAFYGAVATQSYDAQSGTVKTQLTCQPVGIFIPPLPVLPPIGQGGSNASGSGGTAGTVGSGGTRNGSCNVSPAGESPSGSVAWLLWAVAASAGVTMRYAKRR